jgi:hypothetical protein
VRGRHTCSALILAVGTVSLAFPGVRAADRDGDGLRDAFEARWGVTDPDRRDTDRDGVIDASDDPDADRLSDLGEQRFGTDPGARDSDGDGTGDSGEDEDRDGLTNGREQDARPIPPGLRPSLSKALRDLPASYANGCHSGAFDPSIHPCIYGRRDGRVRIALFGDSHALQWLPALGAAGKPRGWRIVTITKSACPSIEIAFAEATFSGAMRSCRSWRASGERWLRRHRQDVVIIANSRGYALVGSDGRRLLDRQRRARWASGLERTIRSLPERTTVLVVADTPHLRQDPPICLRHHPTRMSRCVSSRKLAITRRHDRLQARTAERLGERFGSLTDAVCPYDPCPVVLGSELIWRNRSHLTATIARRLAPSMRTLIDEALATRS